MSRPAPPIKPSPPGKGKGVTKFRRYRLSDEGRASLSEKAKKRHAESDGRGFGRGQVDKTKQLEPRKPKKPSQRRIAAQVAEAARDEANARAIVDVFQDGIAKHQPINIRIKAAEAWIKVEHEDAKLSLREDSEDQKQRSRDELIQLLASKFASGPASQMIRRQLESPNFDPDDPNIIDLQPVDDSDEEE